MLFFFLSASLIAQAAAPASPCWTSVSGRATYSTPEQVRELQAQLKVGHCDVIGIAWTTKSRPSSQNLVVWEGKAQTLWRLNVEGQNARWEKWSGASRDKVLADNPADGFTLGAYTQGRGRTAMSPAAGGFVKQHAPSKFDAGLPVNCDAPAPAPGGPPFLTKCDG